MATRLRLRALAGAQASTRAVTRLLLDQARRSGLVAFKHQVPDLAFGVAKARKRAQLFRIVKHQGRTLGVLGLFVIGLAAGRLGAIKADTLVRAIAERLGG